jgi:hypothetical protein
MWVGGGSLGARGGSGRRVGGEALGGRPGARPLADHAHGGAPLAHERPEQGPRAGVNAVSPPGCLEPERATRGATGSAPRAGCPRGARWPPARRRLPSSAPPSSWPAGPGCGPAGRPGGRAGPGQGGPSAQRHPGARSPTPRWRPFPAPKPASRVRFNRSWASGSTGHPCPVIRGPPSRPHHAAPPNPPRKRGGRLSVRLGPECAGGPREAAAGLAHS